MILIVRRPVPQHTSTLLFVHTNTVRIIHMDTVKRVRDIVVKDLASPGALLETYNAITYDPTPFNHQVVGYVARRVLESNEIKNAMSYAKIEPEGIFNRIIENSVEILELQNSPMVSLTAYDSNNDSSVIERVSQVGENLVRAVDDLSTQVTHAIMRLIAGVTCVYIALNISIGFTLGAFAVLAVNLILVPTVLLTIWLAAGSGGNQWVVSEEDTDIMARTIIAPFVREQINAEMRKAHLADSFNVTIAPGLSDLSDREQIVETATMRRVRTLLSTMTYGSIGVSGARGTGKSVLLRAFCDERLRQHDNPEFGILVSAPVDYDGRDFILHLFSTLCQRIIGLSDISNENSALRRSVTILWQLGIITGICLIAAEAGLKLSRSEIGWAERSVVSMVVVIVLLAILSRFTGVRLTTSTRHAPAEESSIGPSIAGPMRDRGSAMLITLAVMVTAVAAAGVFLTSKVYVSPDSLVKHLLSEKRFWPGAAVSGFALIIGVASFLISRKRKGSHPNSITERAREHLRRIDSIRTVTSGQSASVGFNQLQLNHSRGSQFTERDLSLPAIVDLYRDFTIDVVTWWRTRHNGQGRVVIGIDELDKITNTESAERFLNEIKAVFGIPGCLYIVSTSQDALLQFERKSLGFRSAFDSAFDDIIRVDTLTLIDTRQLLLKRIAGISYPFIVLCHIFSGGLSRDILRSARTIVEARCNGSISLTEICRFLISREIAELKKALLTAYSGQGNQEDGYARPPEGAFIGTLLDDKWPGTSSSELLSAVTPDLTVASPEMYTTLCFLATVHDLTANRNRNPWSEYFSDGTIHDGVENLSGARRWLNSDPKTALELIRVARDKLGLGPLVGAPVNSSGSCG